MPEDYQVTNEKIKGVLKELGESLAAKLPEGWGMTLLIFDYDAAKIPDESRAMFYLSTAERGQMVQALEEFISKQKGEQGNGDPKNSADGSVAGSPQ